jgi:chromosome partitioning protein
MTPSTYAHPYVVDDVEKDRRTGRRTDRRADSRIDGRTYSTADAGSAFVIVLANHKGGVTKTTSTANLGACLAEAERMVLIVDADPQANLSEAFGWSEELPGERLEDLLAHPEAAERYRPPPALQPDVAPALGWRERLRIIPCSDALADVAADLPVTAGAGWEHRLAEVLAALRPRFDVVLIDTPPGLGNLSGMAMLAGDGLVIPARPAALDVRGAGKLYDLVESTVPELRILGVLLAASEQRWRVARDASEQMAAESMRVLPVQVPRTVRVASAPRYRAPTVVLEPDSMVSHAYRQLAEYLLREVER